MHFYVETYLENKKVSIILWLLNALVFQKVTPESLWSLKMQVQYFLSNMKWNTIFHVFCIFPLWYYIL